MYMQKFLPSRLSRSWKIMLFESIFHSFISDLRYKFIAGRWKEGECAANKVVSAISVCDMALMTTMMSPT